ncbi:MULTISPECIES: fimbrial protein FimV [unclassified Acinetobacter]|uniref:fimbrial protein FimV n=1 Tax=unclassified Acinetobacter TaxID=196816 RepID=UPI0015D2993D|nr:MULTISPECIES: fimbrial protein FimV [unclassified Acinetobacter]
MLIYVIPLVILVIVLVFLNKRQKDQESDKAKPTSTKTKKTGVSAKATPKKTQVVESSVIEKKSMTPLTTDARGKIEKLIAERNFFSAEAQINQSLKRDNSQHELYLYLLDIHILQKDEFAISQLLSHIRSLELDEILEQAEAKKVEFENSQNVKDDAINFVSPITEEAPSKAQNTSDFDALMQSSTAAPVEPKAAEIKPLDFNFTTETPAKADISAPVESAPAEKIQPLEFDTLSISPEPVLEAAPKTEEIAQPSPAVEEIKPIDFAPSTEAAVETKTETVEEKIEPLDFSFTTETPVVEENKVEAPALNFDLGAFETAKTEEAVVAPATEFNLESTPEDKPAAPASSGVSFDISGLGTPSTPSATDQNDPLVQSFPELVEVNEIELNLELAAQYIKLGAYDAAREILTEKEAEFSSAQRQQADQLLNQIAS